MILRQMLMVSLLMLAATRATAQPTQPLVVSGGCIVRLTFNPVPGGGGTYAIGRASVPNPTDLQLETVGYAVTSDTYTTYFDDVSISSYSPGTTLYYWMRVHGVSGDYWASAGSIVIGTPVSAPATMTASDDTYCDKVKIDWAFVSGHSQYEIVRNAWVIDTVTAATQGACTYNDTTAVAGTTYTYAVRTVGTCNNAESTSNTGRRAVTSLATSTLTATTTCAAAYIDLSWTSVNTATSYVLQMASGGSWTTLATVVPPASRTYRYAPGPNDPGFFPGTNYSFRVVASNACTSSTSASVTYGPGYAPLFPSSPTATPPLKGATLILTSSISNPYFATTYAWYRNGTAISNGSGSFGTVSGAATDTLTITNTSLAAAGTYRLDATNSCGTTTGPNIPVVVRCGLSDLGSTGGVTGPNGQISNDDQIAFYTLFFAEDPRADLGMSGGLTGSDGLFDNNDEVVFWNNYFIGCP